MLHTLGPWRSAGRTVYGVDGKTVAVVVTEADARLIAQAPEMLKLLSEMATGRATIGGRIVHSWDTDAKTVVDKAIGLRA